MLQLAIAMLYGLAVFTFATLSAIELWKSRQSKLIKIIGAAAFGGVSLVILSLTFWLATVFKNW